MLNYNYSYYTLLLPQKTAVLASPLGGDRDVVSTCRAANMYTTSWVALLV